MKKLFTVLLTLALCFCLCAACAEEWPAIGSPDAPVTVKVVVKDVFPDEEDVINLCARKGGVTGLHRLQVDIYGVSLVFGKVDPGPAGIVESVLIEPGMLQVKPDEGDNLQMVAEQYQTDQDDDERRKQGEEQSPFGTQGQVGKMYVQVQRDKKRTGRHQSGAGKFFDKRPGVASLQGHSGVVNELK